MTPRSAAPLRVGTSGVGLGRTWWMLTATVLLALVGCGPRAVLAPQVRSALLVRTNDAGSFDALRDRVDDLRLVAPGLEPGVELDRHRALLDRVRQLYRDLDFQASLEAASDAARQLQPSVVDRVDIDALYALEVYRGMNELALERPDRARAAFRAAIILRPDETLSEGTYPPDVRQRYDEVRSELRGEPPVASSVETVPTDATVELDGEPLGVAPVSFSVLRGTHYVRASAPLFEPRTLALEVAPEMSSPRVALTARSGDALVSSLSVAALESVGAARAPELARLFGAQVVLVAEPLGEGWQAAVLRPDDGTVERAETATPGEAGLAALISGLITQTPTAEPPGEPIEASPWLWLGVGGAVAAVAAIVVGALLSQPTGHTLVISSTGR